MQFEEGKVYSHIRMLDVAIYVLDIIYQELDQTFLKIRWCTKAGRDMNQIDKITIVASEFDNWYEIKGERHDNV